MKPTKSIPQDYSLRFTFNLREDLRLAIGLQVAGVILFFISGGMFLYIVYWMRPDVAAQGLQLPPANLIQQLRAIALMLIVLVAVVTLHELIHGACFWWFTREPPRYGIGPGYAFAASPDWYLPRGIYLVIGLAPLVVITALGLFFISFSSIAAITPLLFAITANFSGAVGDLWIIYRIAQERGSICVKDLGDGFSVYGDGG
jgi:hypothetical protein